MKVRKFQISLIVEFRNLPNLTHYAQQAAALLFHHYTQTCSGIHPTLLQ
jgi:hypothetical protein